VRSGCFAGLGGGGGGGGGAWLVIKEERRMRMCEYGVLRR
jgi:hypothetical protein